MENDNNWNHHQQDEAPQDYTKHPTGARFIPETERVGNDKFIASKPEKLEALQNDLENDYPNTNSNTLQANGRTDIATPSRRHTSTRRRSRQFARRLENEAISRVRAIFYGYGYRIDNRNRTRWRSVGSEPVFG